MSYVEFIRADPLTDRDELIALNVEYLSWVFGEVEATFGVPADEVVGMPVREYVPTVIDKVCGAPPPKGIFYLVRLNGVLAGMGGLRNLSDQAVEIKRLYVRPGFRGARLGQLIFERLLADAAAFGYQAAYLDSGLFMTAAHQLYETCGFVDCPAYDGVEVPSIFHGQWRFMRRVLDNSKPSPTLSGADPCIG
jgi:GNAT superfamily N-acetyltransferase